MVPVHPASERLRAQRIREWVWQAIPLARHAVEPIPGRLRRELRMAGVADSLVASHFPADEHAAEAGRERLAFEELFLYQAALVSRRGRRVGQEQGDRAASRRAPASGRGSSRCPFALTGDQRRAIEEVDSDLGRRRSRCSGC